MKLEEINRQSPAELKASLGACLGSKRWLEAMATARPFADLQQLLRATALAAIKLERPDWLEAFAQHPRIGDLESLQARFGARSGDWSHGEQASAAGADAETLRQLAAANAEYEERFGYLFIVCASGKRADEMLEILRSRLGNDPAVELGIAAAEQLKITRMRLHRLLESEGPDAAMEDEA